MSQSPSMSKKQCCGSSTPLQCGRVAVVEVVPVMVVTVAVVVVDAVVVVVIVVVVVVAVVVVVSELVVNVKVSVAVVVIVSVAVVMVAVDVVPMQVPQVTGQSAAMVAATTGFAHWGARAKQGSGSGSPLQCGMVVVSIVLVAVVVVEVVQEPQRSGHRSWMIGPSSNRSHMPALNASHWIGSGVPKQFGVVWVVEVRDVFVVTVAVVRVLVVSVVVVVVVESTHESQSTGQPRETMSAEKWFVHMVTV